MRTRHICCPAGRRRRQPIRTRLSAGPPQQGFQPRRLLLLRTLAPETQQQDASAMAALTHLLAVLFGLGSWVSINGLWVELPVLVPQVPEGWLLPSYLSVLIQAANVGPLAVTLMHRLRPGVLNEAAVIYAIVALGAVASFLLAFFWRETAEVAGAPRSLALLVLTFFLAAVDCTSSVTFLPFMTRLPPHFLTSYFIGEGLSGLLPALAALAQGVGLLRCVNGSQALNHSGAGRLEARYQPPNFSAEVFFFFLSAMMLVSLAAFLLLDLHPAVARQQPARSRDSSRNRAEQRPMMDPDRPQNHKPGRGSCSQKQLVVLFVALGWVNALSNTVLPSVQSYACLPYGNGAYHLAAALAAVSNPLAGFAAMLVSIRSLVFLGFLTVLGTGIGSYIMLMAALSPCPLLVNDGAGAAIMVLAWILFIFSLSYVKVVVGLILRDEGHSALVWCGAVVQLGSLLGAATMFPLVSVYGLFSSGDPCSTSCP